MHQLQHWVELMISCCSCLQGRPLYHDELDFVVAKFELNRHTASIDVDVDTRPAILKIDMVACKHLRTIIKKLSRCFRFGASQRSSSEAGYNIKELRELHFELGLKR